MNDESANVILTGMLDLACSVRDDGAPEIAEAARRVLDAAHGDPVAALTVAACLIRVDLPVDAWWQRGLAGIRPTVRVQPCGTHAAYVRHQQKGEPIDPACRGAERTYQRERRRIQRARRRSGVRTAAA